MSVLIATEVSRIGPTELLLTEREVADVFRVTPRTIRRWAAGGTLDAIRVHGTTRYRADDVAALIDPSTSETRTTNAGLAKGDGRAGDPSPPTH